MLATLTGSVHLFSFLLRPTRKNPEKVLRSNTHCFSPGSRFRLLTKHRSAFHKLKISRGADFLNACGPSENRTRASAMRMPRNATLLWAQFGAPCRNRSQLSVRRRSPRSLPRLAVSLASETSLRPSIPTESGVVRFLKPLVRLVGIEPTTLRM